MRLLTGTALLAGLGLLASTGLADSVTFRDGRTIRGTYLGGDTRSVKMAVGDRVESYSLGDISTISFDAESAQSAPPPPPPPVAPRRERLEDQAPPPPPPAPVRADRDDRGFRTQREIPNGTTLTIRMVDSVDSERDKVGQTFRASLDEPIFDPSGNTIVPRGADVMVKLVDDVQSGKIEGRTVLTLDVVWLKIDGQEVDIDTTAITEQSSSRTARSGKVIGGTAALGAIIGAIAGGGKGAAIGAGAGAGAGTAAQVATKGQRVRIPSETRLTFTLQQAVRF